MTPKRRGPGLVKTGALALLRGKRLELWRSSDYRLRELFETADVVSEGATRQEQDGAVYYGSTSVILPLASRGGSVPDEQLETMARLIAGDPHARVRAVRIACLEAQVRADGPIGRVRAELFVREDPRGVRLDVEVEANVFAETAPTPSLRRTRPSEQRRRKRGRSSR